MRYGTGREGRWEVDKVSESRKEKFTPGPWEVGYGLLDGGYLGIWKSGSETVVARISPTDRETDEDKANAHLIAAAPDMYAALEEARDICCADNCGSYHTRTYKEWTALLSKARGES